VKRPKLVLLLSGGYDSFAYGALLQPRYYIYALTFNYAQRAQKEIEYAKKQAEYLGIANHKILDLRSLIEVRKAKGRKHISYTNANRDLIFLSIASQYAKALDCHHIAYGATVTDFRRFPDCRPEFIKAFEEVANLGVGSNYFRFHAPVLTRLTKRDLVSFGLVPPGLSWSCKRNGKQHCGKCRSCQERKEAGLSL